MQNEATRKPDGKQYRGAGRWIAQYSCDNAAARYACDGIGDDAASANKASQVVVMAAIAKFYRRLTYD
jgi:hypothetical protein